MDEIITHFVGTLHHRKDFTDISKKMDIRPSQVRPLRAMRITSTEHLNHAKVPMIQEQTLFDCVSRSEKSAFGLNFLTGRNVGVLFNLFKIRLAFA